MKKKTYLIDEKSKVYKNEKLFLGGYAVLVALFIFFMVQCKLSFGVFEVLAVCFVGVICALSKSRNISLLIIDERVKKAGIKIELGDEKPIMFAPTLLCFVNYVVGLLTLVVCGELLVKELRATLWSSCGWMIIVLVLLGIAVVFFGNYLVKNSASLFNVEPEPLAKEHIAKEKKEEDRAFHERMGMTWYEPEGGIAGFDPKFSWFKADILFLWLAVMTVCFIVEKHSPDNTDYERYEYEYYDDEERHNYFN